MDSWPADEKSEGPHTIQRKGKGKGKEKSPPGNYPSLEQGSVNAVTLIDDNGRLEWTSIAKYGTQERTLRTERPVTIFPPTRPPSLRIPRMTIRQRAEQGANFLRTHLPDVEVAAELIRAEIAEDAEIMGEFVDFDPYAGNLLEPIVRYDGPSEKSAFLAFPMGELNRDLNISPFTCSKKNVVVFQPASQPVYTFDTPIHHITSSKPTSSGQTFLAVRTFGATSLLKLSGSTIDPQLTEVVSLVRSDFEGNQLVDIKIAPTPFETVMVNDRGGVFKFVLPSGQKPILMAQQPDDASTDSFWRLALGDNHDTCLLTSGTLLRQLDFRTTNTSSDLFSANLSGEVITSIDDFAVDNIIRLSSTSQIIWIDRRHPGKPLMGFKHGREFDRTLEVQTACVDNAYLTLLTSRKNGLVTIYDVSRGDDSLIHLNHSPYCLPYVKDDEVFTGHSLFQHPLHPGKAGVSFLRLSSLGGIYQVDLLDSDRREGPIFEREWSTKVKGLGLHANNLRADIGPLGAQEFSEVNLFSAYDDIFRTQAEQAKITEEESADAVYDLLDRLPSFWQGSNAPVEHMLTSYDVVFRAGDEPAHPSRADFLTESILNSKRGYRALTQGRLSPQVFQKDAAWHLKISSILQQFDPTVSDDCAAMAENLREFDLAPGLDRPAQSLRRESEAREQLIVDLGLSNDVFSAQPFPAASMDDHQLESMTEALSLGSDPASVNFSYLRPIARSSVDHYTKEEKEEVKIPVGVRLLLQDWATGADPEDYVYQEGKDNPPEESTPLRQHKGKPTLFTLDSPIIPHSQAPPLVLATSSIVPQVRPEFSVKTPLVAQSQDTTLRFPFSGSQPATSNWDLPGSSQEFMASTQVLPGPHGGRPPVGKKKSVKKRLGGF